jgi:hypothetical protein
MPSTGATLPCCPFSYAPPAAPTRLLRQAAQCHIMLSIMVSHAAPAAATQGFLPYFKETAATGTAAGWFGRSFGAALTSVASGAVFEPDSTTVTKMMAVGMVCVLPNIVLAALDKDLLDVSFLGANIWQLQLVPHTIATGLLVSAAMGPAPKEKK